MSMGKTKNLGAFRIAGQAETLFGSRSAAYTLLYIESYGSGYAAQIAKTFDLPQNAVKQQLRKFETDGILISYTIGRTRVFEFNPRSSTVQNLRQFLAAELEYLKSDLSSLPSEIYQQCFEQRKRPRRSGKPLTLVPKELKE